MGVIAAGVLVQLTGNGWWDTIVALAIGVFVAVRAVLLGREVLAVLGQHVPEGMEIDDVVADLEAVDGVADVHDLHVWTLTSGMHVATAHLVLAGPVRPRDSCARLAGPAHEPARERHVRPRGGQRVADHLDPAVPLHRHGAGSSSSRYT